jgi:hypothetical protein
MPDWIRSSRSDVSGCKVGRPRKAGRHLDAGLHAIAEGVGRGARRTDVAQAAAGRALRTLHQGQQVLEVLCRVLWTKDGKRM